MSRDHRRGGEAAISEPSGIDQPVQRLRTSGPRRPIAVAVGILAVVLVLVWQPWGRSPSAARPSDRPTTPVAVAPGSAPGSPTAPSSSVPTADGQAIDAYVSLTDNEWTVVALLAPDALSSTEEPSIQHASGATWSPDGPFIVLQQGASYTSSPVERPGHPDDPCLGPGNPRYRPAVHLPAGRVAYVGVTFPGMDRRATVTVSVLGRSGIAVHHVSPLVVRLGGMTEGRQYAVPSTGPGGTILFASAPPSVLPPAAYRFEVRDPGIAGRRFLYACIDS